MLNIRRGIYAVVSPGESPNDLRVDPYLLTAKITLDSLLSYHTALELYGVAYSIFNRLNHWCQAPMGLDRPRIAAPMTEIVVFRK